MKEDEYKIHPVPTAYKVDFSGGVEVVDLLLKGRRAESEERENGRQRAKRQREQQKTNNTRLPDWQTQIISHHQVHRSYYDHTM